MKIAPIVSLQPPYSLLDRDAESSILPFALNHQIGVIVYSPMASGLLTGSMTRERIAAMPADDWRKNSRTSRSLCSPAIYGWWRPCAPSASASMRRRARSPSHGPCRIPLSPPRSSASAVPDKSAASPEPPTSTLDLTKSWRSVKVHARRLEHRISTIHARKSASSCLALRQSQLGDRAASWHLGSP